MAIKVGVFCPTLHYFGGGEFVTIAIANTLAQNNHQVILFTTKQVNPKSIRDFFGETLHPSIKTLTQPTNVNPKGLAGFYQTIFRSYIAKSKCNLFIDAYSNCVFPWNNISYIHYPTLNQYSFRKQFPYLLSPHHTEVGIIPHVVLEKNLVSYNDKLVLANSHYTAQQIQKFSGKQAQVLYPPYTSSIKNTQETPKENLVVTVSRFEPNKKLENIPKIASQASKDIKYAVIGRLYNKATLTALESTVKKLDLTDRVKFYPDLPAKQKLELLARAKVYLHTMVGEHFGISIVEAMASGCIPIVHNSGGMKEFVPAKYRYETLQDAADKIDSAINDWTPEKTEQSKSIAENFSIENFSLRFMDFFAKYIN
jgi:alpha-1,2-mannosyltransferase